MEVLITDRQEGKTTQLMNWVKDGTVVNKYPGWSRVAIVANRQRYEYVRNIYWELIDDFDHRVFMLSDIQNGRFPSRDTSYRLDDLDEILSIFLPGINVDGFTITGSMWENK